MFTVALHELTLYYVIRDIEKTGVSYWVHVVFSYFIHNVIRIYPISCAQCFNYIALEKRF